MTQESVEPQAQEAPPQPEEGVLDLRMLTIRVGIGFLVIVTVVGAAGYFFREPLVALSAKFVKLFGGLGVAFGWFVVDAFTFPLPNDAFSFFGLQGGMGFWVVSLWALGGSMLGGVMAYFIGTLLRKHPRFIRFMEGPGAEAYQLVRRYGLVALFIAALTPIPYSIASYACGVVRVSLWKFLLISLARLPRIVLYLFVIQKGFISFSAT